MAQTLEYQETIDYLFGLQKHGVKLALANSVHLMSLMGEPHKKFRAVHVAGTNGKGSTSAFIANMLQAAGYRVGLYTSPHLISFTERIRINAVPITEDRVVELAQRVRAAGQSGKSPLNPTFFEVTTAMAFTCFAEEGVDIAVVEVGMGGRLDSTNVLTPLVSVITNIDIEHTEFLGDTLSLIAREKAGIIKQEVPVVTGAVQPEAVAVIEQEAVVRRARVHRMMKDFAPEHIVPGPSQRFDYRGLATTYRDLGINMLGGYQVDNACLAVATAECLREAGIVIDEASLRRGLELTRWEGRLEQVARRPDIYLDGAHNPASARMLARAVGEMKSAYDRIILVIGILGDKDYGGILSELLPLADSVVVTRPDYGRAMDVQILASEVRKLHGSVNTADTMTTAIEKARQTASSGDLILITGSLYIVGDARNLLMIDTRGNGALWGLKG